MPDPRLKEITNQIQDSELRRKIVELLEDPTVEIQGRTYSALPIDVAPAGLFNHHCYPGGYVEHVVSTVNIATAMCDSVEEVYHGKVNRDIVIAGVLLHDIFKLVSYVVRDDGSYDSSPLADRLDHISIAVAELHRRRFPLALIHVVCAHHGDFSPVRPRTIEALICHLADYMDSQLNGKILKAAKYLTRKALHEEIGRLTSEEAFAIVASKTAGGWDKVIKTVKRIKQKRTAHKT